MFVATENNSVYALDAKTGASSGGRTSAIPSWPDTLPCGNIEPVTGITGTPVIDPSTGCLYVVSFSEMHHTLSALNVSTGAVVFQRAADPPGFNDTTQQERYRAHARKRDGLLRLRRPRRATAARYHGWVVGLPTSGTGADGLLSGSRPKGRGGSGRPRGSRSTRRGTSTSRRATGRPLRPSTTATAVIKLSPTLSRRDTSPPRTGYQLNQDDADLGSVGPAIVGRHRSSR